MPSPRRRWSAAWLWLHALYFFFRPYDLLRKISIMKIKFLGAVGCVTGSCSLLEFPQSKIRFLVDCGMTQGENDAVSLNSAPWPFAAFRLSFVLLTHAHLDHCGLLARLVREGFSGPVYCTGFTAGLALLNLLSAARLPGAQFTVSDVERINFSHVDSRQGFKFGKHLPLENDLEAAFYPTAHIGGSCSIGVRWRNGEQVWREIVFSGDIGPNTPACAPQPLLAPREPLPTRPDYMVVESTYGSRIRPDRFSSSTARVSELQRILQAALDLISVDEQGDSTTIIVPSFSIHRCQELLVDFHAALEVGLRDQITSVRPAYSNPDHLESALVSGIREGRVLHRYGILSELDSVMHARFHELFHLQIVTRENGKTEKVFLPVDRDEETLADARAVLQQTVNRSQKVRVKVWVDSPLAQRVTRVYRRELRRRCPDDPAQLLYRHPGLKEHFGLNSEAEVDSILDRIFIEKTPDREAPCEESFMTYTLAFCHPGQSEELLSTSKGLNIILSGSGMADVGPVVPHLQRHLRNPRSFVLLTGYAPPSTVAGQLRALSQTGAIGPAGYLGIQGEDVPDAAILASIEDLGPYYSGHADQAGLLDFVFSLPASSTGAGSSAGEPSQTTVFLNHGGNSVREALSAAILERSSQRRVDDRKVSSVELPQRGLQWFDLDGAAWLPPEPFNQQEDPQEFLLRLLMEQRRTNDLLMELIQLNRQRSERPHFVKR
jgi:metallo-beta-lactamase family protein